MTHCVNETSFPSPEHTDSKQERHPPEKSLDHKGPEHPDGEVIAWEACGRLVKQERADFYEFVACNVVFAAIAVLGVFVRSRRMQVLQTRQLAARIGLPRNVARR